MSLALAARVAPGGYVGPVRKPADILAFMVHMAESGPRRRVADYLAGKPLRNVSVHYTIELDGSIVPMLPELRVAGSLDPRALRSTTGPYYGRDHLDFVLGAQRAADLTPGPNHWVIAVEVAGTAKAGPNPRQVASLIALFNDCRKRYPRIKPLGHRDQQDVKPCPGGTQAMRLAFRAMGGHGKDYRIPKPPPPPPPPTDDCATQLAAAQVRIDALEAAIAAAIGDLNAAVPATPD